MALLSVGIGIFVFVLSMFVSLIGVAIFSWPGWFLLVPVFLGVVAVIISFPLMVWYTRK